MTGLELDWKRDGSDSIADDALGVLVSALEFDECQGGMNCGIEWPAFTVQWGRIKWRVQHTTLAE